MIKTLPTNAGDVDLIPGSGRSPEKAMETHSSVLAWEIPQTEEPGGLQSIGSQRVRLNIHELKVKGHVEVVGQPFLLTSALDLPNYSLLS